MACRLKTHCLRGHAYEGENIMVRPNGQRRCRQCVRETNAAASSRRPPRDLMYRIWVNIHQRCGNPQSTSYPWYGARGISVCSRWASFDAFRADMGERPEGMEIDRIDNDGPYSPENCRWATRTQQVRNSRAAKLSDVAALCIRALWRRGARVAVLARSFGVERSTVYALLNDRTWTGAT